MQGIKNVLYISYDGMTDSLGQSQVIPYLIGLSKKGYSFTILSCEKKDNYQSNSGIIANVLSSNNIKWEPVFYTKNPPVLSTLYDYYNLINKARSLHVKHSFNMLHCRSYISSLVGLWMKRKYDIPFIFDMRGFWANERVDGGLWNIKKPLFKIIYSFFKKKELEFINKSAAVISLTEKGKHEILTWKELQFTGDKIVVIPCCVDTDLFDPGRVDAEQQKILRQKLNISNQNLVVGYLGSIGTWYLLDEMMEFFACLKKQVPLAKFLFVTHDDETKVIDAAKRKYINTDDIIVTKAGRQEVPVMISLFTYGLFFIKPSYSKMASSPTKQGEIMAMNVPVICNSGVGDTDTIVNKYNSGIIVNFTDYNQAVYQIANSNLINSNIRPGAIDYFSLDNGVKKYYDVYRSITLNS